MTEYDNDLLREGILRYKAGEPDKARTFFERALGTADDMQTRALASLYLSRLTDDPQCKRKFLEDTLAVDMSNAEARRELAILNGRLKRDEIVNPDILPAPLSGNEKVDAKRFICPKCGGRMTYTPDGAFLFCEFCNRKEQLPADPPKKQQDFFIAMADGRGFSKTVSVKTFQCGGCGATFMLPPSQLSATCAYCGSNHVLVLQGKRDMLTPDVIIPLQMDQKQANQYLAGWIEKMHIQPQKNTQPPACVFLPVWLFDISGCIPWKGKIVKDKREVPVSGEKTFDFCNLCIPGTNTLRGLLKKSLSDYDFSQAPAYDPRYLAGWLAEVPETSMSDASLDARQMVVEKVQALIREEFGRVSTLTYATSKMSVYAYKLALVPAWITVMTVKGQTGRVFINGCSGGVHTDLPGLGPGWLETLREGGRLVGEEMVSRKKKGGS